MKCKYCGAEVQERFSVCTQCGRRLDERPKATGPELPEPTPRWYRVLMTVLLSLVCVTAVAVLVLTMKNGGLYPRVEPGVPAAEDPAAAGQLPAPTAAEDPPAAGQLPVIRVQPESVTADVGETVQFTVSAEGEDLSYQWQYLTFGTGEWSDSGMDDALTPTVSVEATPERNGRQYRCIVSNRFGTAISEAAVMDVRSAPVIFIQPESVTTGAGNIAAFRLEARGGDMTCRWQWKDPGSDDWTDLEQTDETAREIFIAASADISGRQYRCIVENQYGSVTTDVVTLTVNG